MSFENSAIFSFFSFLAKSLRRGLLPVLLVFIFGQNIASQEFRISGKVYERATLKILSFTSVYDVNTTKGTITSDSGFFEISLTEGQHNLVFSYVGYERLDTTIQIREDLVLSLFLTPLTISTKEVIVSSRNFNDHATSSQMSTISLSSVELKELPSLLGETDPLKLLQLTPGVQAASEGNTGFYVRGGGTDQNLILYDNTVVYNPGHLLGFFSVFNPELVKDVVIIKSGIPARYGGKLSSVVTINSFRGNNDSLEVTGNIGLISTRIAINGPVFKKKGSFIVGGRQTYLGLMVLPLVKYFAKNTAFFKNNSTYNFADFNAGLTFNFSRRDALTFSGYYGNDIFGLKRTRIDQENSLKWGNTLSSLQWSHKIGSNSVLYTSVSRTIYKFDLLGSQSDYYFKLLSSIEDHSFKSDISFRFLEQSARAGIEFTDHSFMPNKIDAQAGNIMLNFAQFSEMHGAEGGIYFDNGFKLSNRTTITTGLRFSFFNHSGPYSEYKRNSLGQISDTIFYPSGKSLAFFWNPEPRIVLKYQIDGKSSLKASYMRIAQYLHLYTSASASLPTDMWLPSTSNIKPQIGNQVSIGYFRNIPTTGLEFSSEIYYKRMENKLEFLRGIIYNSLNGNIEQNIVAGSGQSYGLELFLRKMSGKSTGWISYTLARTEQKFDQINEGLFYPAKYDRRHEVSLAFVQKFSEKWSGSAVFIYISGNAYTMPIGRYMIQGNIVNEYGKVNSFRMPPYHRMDVSFNRKVLLGNNFSSELIFSVFNLYNRANPYYIYFDANGDIDRYSLEVKAVQVCLFPVIPSVSWSFKF